MKAVISAILAGLALMSPLLYGATLSPADVASRVIELKRMGQDREMGSLAADTLEDTGYRMEAITPILDALGRRAAEAEGDELNLRREAGRQFIGELSHVMSRKNRGVSGALTLFLNSALFLSGAGLTASGLALMGLAPDSIAGFGIIAGGLAGSFSAVLRLSDRLDGKAMDREAQVDLTLTQLMVRWLDAAEGSARRQSLPEYCPSKLREEGESA